jgi:hypothetical protein
MLEYFLIFQYKFPITRDKETINVGEATSIWACSHETQVSIADQVKLKVCRLNIFIQINLFGLMGATDGSCKLGF